MEAWRSGRRILVPLALGVSPVYSVLIGLSCSGLGILPGFIAGYLMSLWLNLRRSPSGLDLIVIIISWLCSINRPFSYTQ